MNNNIIPKSSLNVYVSDGDERRAYSASDDVKKFVITGAVVCVGWLVCKASSCIISYLKNTASNNPASKRIADAKRGVEGHRDLEFALFKLKNFEKSIILQNKIKEKIAYIEDKLTEINNELEISCFSEDLIKLDRRVDYNVVFCSHDLFVLSKHRSCCIDKQDGNFIQGALKALLTLDLNDQYNLVNALHFLQEGDDLDRAINKSENINLRNTVNALRRKLTKMLDKSMNS